MIDHMGGKQGYWMLSNMPCFRKKIEVIARASWLKQIKGHSTDCLNEVA